jgi:hypothetical protein
MDERLLDVDQYGVLRVPGMFWLGMAVLVRYWALMLVMLMSAQQAGTIFEMMGSKVPWLALAGEVFALVVVVTAGSRQPEAGRVWRWTWRHAHVLLAMTAACNVAWFIYASTQASWEFTRPQVAMAGFALLDVCMAWIFLRSTYFRQLFSEFPEPVKQ